MSLRYYITDRRALGGTAQLLAVIKAAMAAGVEWIQVREKDLGGRELAELVGEAMQVRGGYRTRVLVNDRVDMALACGADGVHLRSGSVAPAKIRRIVGREFLIGVSCHSIAEVRQAEEEGADFAVFGPVFASPGKGPPLGLDALGAAAREVKIPVLALGGVTVERVRECERAGAAGVAGIRLFQRLG